jgi:hypothetical protein
VCFFIVADDVAHHRRQGRERGKKLDSVMSTMSLFSPSNANKFITHTPFPLEMIVQELIDYPY